jgi:hypothetical protein
LKNVLRAESVLRRRRYFSSTKSKTVWKRKANKLRVSKKLTRPIPTRSTTE